MIRATPAERVRSRTWGASLTEAARALAGEAEVEVGLEPHQVTFAGGDRRLTARLVEGEFPPVRNLLPTGLENMR